MNQRFIYYFDLETTGTNARVDRPVQIGLLFDQRIVMNSLCDPCQEIAKGASDVHGITKETVVGHPDYLMALWTFFRMLPPPSEAILCGYNNSTYDSVMIDACMTKTSFQITGKYDQIDVLDLLFRYEPELPSKKLTDAYQSLCGEELVGAHGAVQDCYGTVAILHYLCEKYHRNPEDFVEELRTPKPYSIMPIGRHRGSKLADVPVGWAQYMQQKATDMRPDLQMTVNAILQG